MSEALSPSQFLQSAAAYLADLKRASGFQETVDMWRSTKLPYDVNQSDPHSPAYRDEILKIYNNLTGCNYDVQNEWTSTLQSPEEFERGYPWVSGNLAIVADEIAKPIQILRALHEFGRLGLRVIEFGSGWGNLAIPLAKAGVEVTLVDIDQGFLDRAHRIAEREGVCITSVCGDFLEVAAQGERRHDVAVFQSSFHHCLDFAELLIAVRDKVIAPGGQILFANEPISTDLNFPWGLRYDGESLWAIMCNKWLELGFHHDFFSELLLRSGFLPQSLPELPSLADKGWRAIGGQDLVPFGSLRLPAGSDAGFHEPEALNSGRFSRGRSVLPPVDGSGMTGWRLEFINYSRKPLSFRIGGDDVYETVHLASGEVRAVDQATQGRPLTIHSDTFVPSVEAGTSDTRSLGIYLNRAALF